MSFNKIVDNIMREEEFKSWEPKTENYFDVGIDRGEFWFWKRSLEQSDQFPRGMSKKYALKNGDRVYEVTETRTRIK